MAFEESRFTLMALPQQVDANGVLTLNILFIPRNINPLKEVNTKFPVPGSKAKAFVDTDPEFEIRIVNDPDEFPGKIPATDKTVSPINPISYSALRETIYKTLRDTKENGKAKYFDIDESRSTDVSPSGKHRATKADTDRNFTIRKYLPKSYRNAFNFTSPRLPNAVTDDSYHCALRDQTKQVKPPEEKQVSWGKVYGYLLRQPTLAKQAGLLYETSIKLDITDFEKGGWIYVNIKNGATYSNEQQLSLADAEGPFIKRYGARIPIIKPNEARQLFAAVLFPVMAPGAVQTSVFDDVFIEAARYHDGFATIVHANQAKSGNLLEEEQNGFHPQKESGIRLGWEDEQILEWYLRQMSTEEGSTERLDSPLGVMGYAVDVKNTNDPETAWESLNIVESNGNMLLEGIDVGAFKGELPYQVYPTKVYSPSSDNSQFWLPMYFGYWNDVSMVLPDKRAANLYMNDTAEINPVKVNETYAEKFINTKLRYGNSYHFRVRMLDISGGGPSVNSILPAAYANSAKAKADFRRYVAPHSMKIENDNDVLAYSDGPNFVGTSLQLSRPILNFPAVLYTGKYSDPLTRLKHALDEIIMLQQGSAKKQGGKAFGIPDPDVVSVQIKVEVRTLQMDNLASDTGRENYITLYTVVREFSPFDENNAGEIIDVPITFKDVEELSLTDTSKPFPNASDNLFIGETTGGILLPTARNIRITMRAIGENKSNYWGGKSHTDLSMNTRYGKTTALSMFKPSAEEKNLLIEKLEFVPLQGIYLQPEPQGVKLNPVKFKLLQGKQHHMPGVMQRLSDQLDVVAKDLTLTAPNGERIVFWCSNLVRHSMAPDSSSITFDNKNQLTNQWLVCTSLSLNRDWSWDSLDVSSIDIERKRKLGSEAGSGYKLIGDVEVKPIASYQAIQLGKDKKIKRGYTRIIIIDVVNDTPVENKFPDTIELQYRLKAKFKAGHLPIVSADYETLLLKLPTSINPRQTPKLINAGLALSPYNRNPRYSATEPRTRYMWLEFDKNPMDNHDGLFCRTLAYAPDQLLSTNDPSFIEIPEEKPLAVDPEYIRVITPASAEDDNGMEAMQLMEKSVDEGRHFYLLPLPPGLHHESPELFGMYTYEFRYGHTDKIWSTAQGRFGRPLRVAGIQHPAPNLACMVQRTPKQVTVTAPYARAVHEGKDVTSNPPKTALWALLYAQVKQADGLDYRNILLSEIELKPKPRKSSKRIREGFSVNRNEEFANINMSETFVLNNVSIPDNILTLEANQLSAILKDEVKNGFSKWTNEEVEDLLFLYGLPLNSKLSIVCVEVYGHITNASEHINDFMEKKDELLEATASLIDPGVSMEMRRNLDGVQERDIRTPNDPLNSSLGFYRILRTSPLTEVPIQC